MGPLPDIPGFRVLGKLGRGGFASVYYAEPAAAAGESPSAGAAIAGVAIKVMERQGNLADERFARELHALRAIGQPHVPLVLDQGTLPDGTPWLAMEYVPDPTLAALLARSGPLSVDEALPLFRRLLVPVRAAHARGFVHRDLKPDNFFVCDEPPHAKLIDFGLACAAGAAAELTGSDQVLGTPEYMAPEQWLGGHGADPRTDVYALGVLLYEMIVGHPPFRGTRNQIQEGHVGHRPAPPDAARVPPAVIAVVQTCLAKDPDGRFADVDALARALDDTAREGPGAPAPAPPPARTQPHDRRATMVLFRSNLDALELQRKVAMFGGELPHAQEARYAAVFLHDDDERAARRALATARALVADGSCTRAVVDVDSVRAQQRKGGGLRITSRRFFDTERYPRDGDAPGVMLAPGAHGLLEPAACRPAPGRPDHLLLLDESAAAPDPQSTMGRAGSGRLFGRERELDLLAQSARTMLETGVPTVTAVLADAGYGKTHLAAALQERLSSLPGAERVTLRAVEPAGGDFDALFRELVTWAFAIDPAAGAEACAAQVRAELDEQAWAGLAVVMGWRSPDDPELAGLSAAPGALRNLAARATAQALRRRAERRPLLILLDDAQFADKPSLDALELAALAEAGARLWICALARPTLRQSRPAWGRRAGASLTVELGPLDVEAAEQLLRQGLRPVVDVPAAVLARLRALGSSVPLLLVELVKGLKREGIVRRHSRGSGWYLATDALDQLPAMPSVQWLAEREVACLPPDLTAHVQLASLLGPHVDAHELAGLLAELERLGAAQDVPFDARVGLRRLATAGILIEHHRGRFGFRHALVRESVASAIPAARRERFHAAAAAYYASPGCRLPDADRRPRLARHLARAGAADRAAEEFLALAREAHARHAYLDAEGYYSAALEGSTSAGGAVALQQRGVVRTRLGRHEDALSDFAAALELAQAADDRRLRVEILLDQATALDWCDEWRGSEQAAQRAAAESPEPADARIAANVLMALGRSHHRFSRDPEAAPLLARAAELAESVGQAGYETLVVSLVLLGYILPGLGRHDEAERAFDRVIPLCLAHGDRWHLAAAYNNRVALWTARNRRDRLVEDLERVREIGRELGYDRMEWFAHFNLGESLFWLGDFAAAEPHVARAIQLDEHSLGDEARPRSELLQARLLVHSGDLRAARAAWRRIVARQERARAADRREALFVPSEQVQSDLVDLSTRAVAARAEEWEALVARARTCCSGQELIEVLETRALAADAAGDPALARAAWDEALAAAERVPNLMVERIRREREAQRP